MQLNNFLKPLAALGAAISLLAGPHPAIAADQILGRVHYVEEGEEGENMKLVKARIVLTDDTLRVVSHSSNTTLDEIPYSSVTSLTYALKFPEWREAAWTSGVSLLFRNKQRWLTVIGEGQHMILRLDKSNHRTVLAAVQSRTGTSIQNLGFE